MSMQKITGQELEDNERAIFTNLECALWRTVGL